MRAFVIKNKEGKYAFALDSNTFTDEIINALIYNEYEKSLILEEYPNLNFVEITIAEGDLEKETEHWHNLFKQKEQQFQSVRERYHLLNRLQADYDKKDKLHLAEMQCLELVEKNEKLEQQLSEKDKQLEKMKKDVKSLKCATDLYSTIASSNATKISIAKEIRKQVCDEIRNYIDNKIYDRFDDQDVDYLTIDLEEFEDLLQDLEQAKENIK